MQDNQAIFQSVFNRDFSDPENRDFLKKITAAHPYFSPAQFYLLQQTDEETEAFKEQASKTAILFNNPFWLNFRLKQSSPYKAENNLSPVTESADDTEDVMDREMEKEIEPMKIELKLPVIQNVDENALLFEPMHLVDYFASQGIKLSDEVQTADKLGKQLKSFTEWLKTMKKVHEENNQEPAGQTDDSIQNMAEKSNTKDEVLTVSMADVFAKQGKLSEAREIFEKLSLLNPAKSAYFAAKIENLKGS